MILSIDTTNNLKTIVKLGEIKLVKTYKKPREQNLLVLIDKILRDNKVSLKDITEIKVNTGPGSFTGTRVGVTVANTLAWALGIKVNGKKMVTPVYKK